MTHEVVLTWADGRTRRLDLPADEPILSAAGERGVSLPVGCLTGACTTCVGKVLDGKVEHERPPRGLKERHLAAGYALLCVARPRDDCRIRVGADVQSELHENPWK